MKNKKFKTKTAFCLSFLIIFFASTFITLASEKINSDEIPRSEHPKPQFYRAQWLNLNGEWNFAFDMNVTGIDKEWFKNYASFDKKIIVPFCPESDLSGIGFKEFIPAVWYHRTFSIPKDWDERVFINFGAVDYDCTVWVNGVQVGRHLGGSASFSFEISNALIDGTNDITVYAVDDIRSRNQPYGKQSDKFDSYSCFYTRTTGIWQTVWLEARSKSYIESVRIIPDLDNSSFVFTPVIENYRTGQQLKVTLLSDEGNEISKLISTPTNGVPLVMKIKNAKTWSPESPYLYKLKFELLYDEKIVDEVESYAGMRKFHIEGHKFFLNNEPIFLRMILDQGFYPDGIWTAPNDDALKADIENSMAIGFNAGRLHQKVFEERYHYWADKLGYLTWGEFYDWEILATNSKGMSNLKREWYEVVKRDLNYPSIITWVPFNERADPNVPENRIQVQEIVNVTRSIDPTRPINDASGYSHVDTDIFTVHDYDQSKVLLKARYDSLSPSKKVAYINLPELSVPYDGEPYMVDEYGGTHWTKEFASEAKHPGDRVWQVGKGKTSKEIENLIEELTQVLLNNSNISGFCYTQLTDVEQEVNGLYTYGREIKFNAQRLKEIFGAPAAIEEK